MKKCDFGLLWLLLLIFPLVSAGQNLNVKGRITHSTTGESIPGVTVVAEGMTGVGTVTDINGNFTISVPPRTTLVFSLLVSPLNQSGSPMNSF